MKFIRRSTFKT